MYISIDIVRGAEKEGGRVIDCGVSVMKFIITVFPEGFLQLKITNLRHY